MSFFQKVYVGLRQGLLSKNFAGPLTDEKAGVIAAAIKDISELSKLSDSLIGSCIVTLLERCRSMLLQMGSTKFARTFEGARFQQEITRHLLAPSLNIWAAAYEFKQLEPVLLKKFMDEYQLYTKAWYGTLLLSTKKLQAIFKEHEKEIIIKNQQELTKKHYATMLIKTLSEFPFSAAIQVHILQVITGELKFLAFLDLMMTDISKLTINKPERQEMMFKLCACFADIVKHFKLNSNELHFFNEPARNLLINSWPEYSSMFKRSHDTPTDAFLHYHRKATQKVDDLVQIFEPTERGVLVEGSVFTPHHSAKVAASKEQSDKGAKVEAASSSDRERVAP